MNQVASQISPQIVGQVLGRSIAIGRILAQAFHADHVQIARHSTIHGTRRNGILLEDTDQRLNGRAERRVPSHQVVQQCSQRVDIDRRSRLFRVASRLFRCHIAGCPHDLSGHGELPRAIRPFGQSEVGDLRWPAAWQQDIARLEITVHDTMLVRMRDGQGQIEDHLGRLFHSESATPQFGRQCRALHIGHHVIMMSRMRTDVINRHDPRVSEARRHFGFGIKPLDRLGRCEIAIEDHLERHVALQFCIASPIDDSHSATGNLLELPIMAALFQEGVIGPVQPANHSRARTPFAPLGVPCSSQNRSIT